MLSLYRSGRQADAVQRFTEVRALLRAELGVDPSPELQQLHRGILDQDEQLGLVDSRTARTPQTLFTRVGDCALAYQVLGNGPIDVVLIPDSPGTSRSAGKIPFSRTSIGASAEHVASC